MMDHAFRIRNYHDHFETYESKKIKGALTWVPIPTKHDGRGYKRVTRHPHAVSALCGWWSLLQVVAKMPVRGLLADRDGPLDAEDIADKTNLPKKIYITAFTLMTDEKIGWLERVPWDKNLDFAGNIAALMESQHLPADTLVYQRTPAEPLGTQRGKNNATPDGNASGRQRTPANASGAAGDTADTSGSAGTTATPLLQDRTGHNSTMPPTIPQGGWEGAANRSSEIGTEGKEGLKFDEAKSFLNRIFGRKKAWSKEEDDLLCGLCPIDRAELDLAEIWFRLPLDHPVWEVTKAKHELTTYLRDFNGENDKMRRHAPLFRNWSVNGSPQKKEPAGWREFFMEEYGQEVRLPERFDQLGADQRKEWELGHDAFEKRKAAA